MGICRVEKYCGLIAVYIVDGEAAKSPLWPAAST
jgi:hypothetical protein